MVGQDTTAEQREQLREQLGLNDPFVVQYARFVANAARGDFGTSYRHRRPVSELLEERLPATLELSFVSAFMALALGIPMGIYTALKRHGVLSKAFMAISLAGISLPTFLIGILLILFFGVQLRWLPSFGRGDVVGLGWWTTGFLTKSGLLALIMPAITLALFQMTLIMRLVRAEMLEVLRADFIVRARPRPAGAADQFPPCAQEHHGAGHHHHRPAAGLHHRLRHHHRDRVPVARHGPAVHPGHQHGGHSRHGGLPVLIAFMFVVINLIVDLLYFAVDPRLRVQSK